MSRKILKDKSSEQTLARLLDALAMELLAAPDHEVAGTLWEMNTESRSALRVTRRLVASLNDSSEPPKVSNFVVPRRRILMTREY
jgi:hypothetical protein